MLDGLRLFEELALDEQEQLRRKVQVFMDEVRFEGCAGLDITDEVRVSIAAQACLLILALTGEPYDGFKVVLVYPASFRGGAEGEAHAGQAWLRGPVILSWADSVRGARHEDGFNPVYHEFAHKLDQFDGRADGRPPLGTTALAAEWEAVFKHEQDRLEHELERGRRPFLRDYAATNPAEFFAVATEAFFERPRRLRKASPRLYACLQAFYGQETGVLRPGPRDPSAQGLSRSQAEGTRAARKRPRRPRASSMTVVAQA